MYHCEYFAEVTVKKGKTLMNTILKVIYDVDKMKTTKTIKAAVLAVDRETKTDVPGYTFTWYLNGKKIGDGMQVVKKHFIKEGVSKYRLKVVARLEDVGSIVRIITITLKRGKCCQTCALFHSMLLCIK